METPEFMPIPLSYPAPMRKEAPIADDPPLVTKGMDLSVGSTARALPTVSNPNNINKPVHALPPNLQGLRRYQFRDESFGGAWVHTDHNFISVPGPYQNMVGQYVSENNRERDAHWGFY